MYRSILINLFRRYRGLSRDSGGTRELSSGIISDRIRDDAIDSVKGLLKNDRLVEIGCGEGLLLSAINQPQRQSLLLGIERESWMIERAKNRFMGKEPAISLVRGIGNLLPLRSESIDIVVCINTFHNQPSYKDVVEILEEMARICKTGGRIIFDIRNCYNPCIYLAYRYVMLYDPTCKTLPLNTYSIFEVTKVLKKVDLKIIRKQAILFPYWLFAPAMVIEAQKVRE